jgi:hypothetical protein
MEESGLHYDPAVLPPGKESLVPIGYGAGWAPNRSGRGGEVKIFQRHV